MVDVAETAREESKPYTELQKFFIKVTTVFVAAFIFLFMATSYVISTIDHLSFLKGGPQFWHDVENKLRAFADAPDMPPPKKAAIVKQIEKVARKYRPFIDALSASDGKS